MSWFLYARTRNGNMQPELPGIEYFISQATYRYIKIKWQILPPITNRWKISCEPKYLWRELNTGSLSA